MPLKEGLSLPQMPLKEGLCLPQMPLQEISLPQMPLQEMSAIDTLIRNQSATNVLTWTWFAINSLTRIQSATNILPEGGHRWFSQATSQSPTRHDLPPIWCSITWPYLDCLLNAPDVASFIKVSLSTPLAWLCKIKSSTTVLSNCLIYGFVYIGLLASEHTLITWPLASEQTLSYATPQCVGILSTFFIIQVPWPVDVWK